MIKFMLFIDGTWLYSNTSRLVEASGEPGFVLDFGRLPRVLAEEVGRRLGHDEWTVVRTHLFGSYADKVDSRDDEPVQRRLNFFSMLRQQHHYEVEAFPINFRGKRLRKPDRDPNDTFEPKEKCVDIALATAMLFNASMPNAYDVAVAVLGDQDFKPVLQSVRRLGKRVAIASIQGACASELSDPSDKERVRDSDIIWLEELLPALARRTTRTCSSASRLPTAATAACRRPTTPSAARNFTVRSAARSSRAAGATTATSVCAGRRWARRCAASSATSAWTRATASSAWTAAASGTAPSTSSTRATSPTAARSRNCPRAPRWRSS